MARNKEAKKALTAVDVIVVAFGAMIGWGWVVSSGVWIQRAGVVGAMLAFMIGGAIMYFVGLTYAELTTAMPKGGGAMAFSNKAFGPIGSFICTWAVVLSYIGVVCFEACSLPTIIQYIFPGFLKGYLYTVAGFDVYLTWLISASVFAIIIVVINIKGLKEAAILQRILTIVIAAVGVVLILISSAKGNISNLSGQAFVGSDVGSVVMNILSVAAVAPFFLFGFDVIPQVAGEINIPLKKTGKLLLLSIALAVSFYGLIVIAIGYGINATDIASSISGNGLVAADAMGILFNSKTMAKILIIGGVCGVITSWNSFLIGGSRMLMAMADAHMIPHVFSKTHKIHKTPYLSIVLIGVLSIISLFFGQKMLVWISDAASFACCFSYCIVAIAFIKLRRIEPSMERPYKVKNYKFIGFIAVLMTGFLCIMYLLPNSATSLTKEEFVIVVGWAVTGLLFALICKIKYKEKFGNISNINEHSNETE